MLKDNLNGGTHLADQVPLDPDAAACVKLLEQVLADAKTGTVRSCVVVVAGRMGPGAAFAGPDVGALNIGLDAAKQSLLASVLAPQQRKSAILRPGRQ